MESVQGRRLLYYVRYKGEAARHWGGSPIHHFLFRDVKTGEEVTLGSCYYNEQVSELMGCYYYEDIEDATKDFDILWKLIEDRIMSVSGTFEEVEREYRRMLTEGTSPEEVNAAMMKFYDVKPVTRRL